MVRSLETCYSYVYHVYRLGSMLHRLMNIRKCMTKEGWYLPIQCNNTLFSTKSYNAPHCWVFLGWYQRFYNLYFKSLSMLFQFFFFKVHRCADLFRLCLDNRYSGRRPLPKLFHQQFGGFICVDHCCVCDQKVRHSKIVVGQSEPFRRGDVKKRLFNSAIYLKKMLFRRK